MQGTANINDYSPRIPSRFEGMEMRCYSSLLNAGRLDHTKGSGCHNIIVRGKGTICGGGPVLAKKIIEDAKAKPKRYGMRINLLDSNPATRVKYLYVAVGMTPAGMNFAGGGFDYGDW